MQEAAELQAAAELDEALGTVSNSVTVKGREIQVRPLEAQQISEILRKVYALKERGTITEIVERAAEMAEGGAEPAAVIKEAVKRIDYFKLFMTGGDEVLDILRVGTYQRKEFVGTLNVLELVKLGKKFVEVNVDFLLRNLPEIREMFGTMKEAKAGFEGLLGGEESTASSTTGTE